MRTVERSLAPFFSRLWTANFAAIALMLEPFVASFAASLPGTTFSSAAWRRTLE